MATYKAPTKPTEEPVHKPKGRKRLANQTNAANVEDAVLKHHYYYPPPLHSHPHRRVSAHHGRVDELLVLGEDATRRPSRVAAASLVVRSFVACGGGTGS